MELTDSQETLVVIVTTLFGGAGLEFIRKVLAKSKDREDSATVIRKELREELTAVRAEIAAAEKELDAWKQKYYELFEMYVMVKVQYDSVVAKLAANKIVHEDVPIPTIEKPGVDALDVPQPPDVA